MGVYERPFWDAVQKRELRLQKCGGCGHVWYPPGPVCPECLSEDWAFVPMSGRGRVVAWTEFHRQYFPDLPVPYLVVSVALDEGPLLIGNIQDVGPDAIRLDLPVEAAFEAALGKDGEWLIVQWRRRASD
jgi:uncharacterized OB-fold protein